MKTVNADDLKKAISKAPVWTALAVKEMIDEQEHIDIVQCQDCKHWVYNFNGCARNPCTEPWYATDFCNYGERSSE